MAWQKTVWVAADKSEWPTQALAEQRDLVHDEVERMLSYLPHIPDNPHVARRVHGQVVAAVQEWFRNVVRRLYPADPAFQHAGDRWDGRGVSARALSEMQGPLDRVNWWLSCYRDGVLYQQPFYAEHPEQFKGTIEGAS